MYFQFSIVRFVTVVDSQLTKLLPCLLILFRVHKLFSRHSKLLNSSQKTVILDYSN